jgi:hypothetical protein
MAKALKLTHAEMKKFQLLAPCSYCQHLQASGTQENNDDYTLGFKDWTCKAFPEGIPSGILRREDSHVELDWGQAIGNSYKYTPKVVQMTNGKAVMSWDGQWEEVE